MAMRHFELAKRAYVETDDGDMVREGTMDGLWVTVASGERHHRPDEAEDPATVTKVIQMTERGWAWALASAIQTAKEGALPGMSPELVINRALHEAYVPRRCWCDHDCCGHRHGYCDVTHVGGTVFMVQIHTSRNY